MTEDALEAITRELRSLDEQLASYDELVEKRNRLLAAKAALLGHAPISSGAKRVSQEQVADYVEKHPGSTPAEIALGLRVSDATIRAHLHRGKGRRFFQRDGGWHTGEAPADPS